MQSHHEDNVATLSFHNQVCGPTSFGHLRTVDGHVFATYRDACQQRGLLEDDQHLRLALAEAAATKPAKLLRSLFAIILTACVPSNPAELWQEFKDHLTEDYLHHHRSTVGDHSAEYSDELYNKCLCTLEDMVHITGGQQLHAYGLPKPHRDSVHHLAREYHRETNYNVLELANVAQQQQDKLTHNQRDVYTAFMAMVEQTDQEQATGTPQ